MKRNGALKEALDQNPHLHRRYTVLSAILFVEILVLLLVYVLLLLTARLLASLVGAEGRTSRSDLVGDLDVHAGRGFDLATVPPGLILVNQNMCSERRLDDERRR